MLRPPFLGPMTQKHLLGARPWAEWRDTAMNICPQGACRQVQALMSPHVSRKTSGREGTRRGCDLRRSIQRRERRPVWEGQEDLSGEELLQLNSEGRRCLWCKERKERGCPAEETAYTEAWKWDPRFTEARKRMWD